MDLNQGISDKKFVYKACFSKPEMAMQLAEG